MARNGLRPVRRLTQAVEKIARTEDLAPLPVEGDDEVGPVEAGGFTAIASLAELCTAIRSGAQPAA